MLSSCLPNRKQVRHSGSPIIRTVVRQAVSTFLMRSILPAPRFWLVKVMAAWKTEFIAV